MWFKLRKMITCKFFQNLTLRMWQAYLKALFKEMAKEIEKVFFYIILKFQMANMQAQRGTNLMEGFVSFSRWPHTRKPASSWPRRLELNLRQYSRRVLQGQENLPLIVDFAEVVIVVCSSPAEVGVEPWIARARCQNRFFRASQTLLMTFRSNLPCL